MKQNTLTKDVIILKTFVDNDVIKHLISNDECDENITPIIKIFAESLSNQGIEVFYLGNTFIVTEKEILIGAYEDEYENEFQEGEILTYE